MKDSEKRLIRGVRNVLRITRILQQVCEQNDFTLPQYRALSWIKHQSMTRPHLVAEQAAVSRPAVASVLSGLEKRGLVKRESVAEDGRGVYVSPTEKTNETLDTLEWAMINRLNEVFGESAEIIAMFSSSQLIEDALDAQVNKEIADFSKKK